MQNLRPWRRSSLGALLWLIVTLALVGCMSAPKPVIVADYAPDAAMNTQADASGLPQDDAAWWQVFNDALLSDLVKHALHDNLDLQAAQQRLLAERSLSLQVGKNYMPQVGWLSQSVTSASGIDTFYQYGFDVSWELGWFGREDSEKLMAQSALMDSSARLHAIRVTLVGDVVRAYLQLRQAQQAARLQTELAHLIEQRQTLKQTGARLGLLSRQAAEHDLQPLNAVKIQQQHWQTEVELASRRLALLCGLTQAQASWLQTHDLHLPRHYPIARLPVKLLDAQPLVQQARAQLLHSAARAGLARADRYPSISLGAGYFYASNITRNIVFDGDTNSAPSIGPVINIPIFDWGRRRHIEKARQMEMDAASQDYRQQVRKAYAEVEENLLQLHQLETTIALQDQSTALAAEALNRAQARVEQGLSGQLPVIATQEQEVQTQEQLLAAEMDAALAYVSLYKSLGGPDEHGSID